MTQQYRAAATARAEEGTGTSPQQQPAQPLLSIEGLRVQYRTGRQLIDGVREASLQVWPGQTVAIVGESGSGKSTTAHAIVRLLAANARITQGAITLQGQELGRASDRTIRAVRGRAIGFVPQDPTVSLNPVQRVGEQVGEVLRIHGLADRKNARHRTLQALAEAGLDEPELRYEQYPHELSGGMRQRVLIAAAVVARPALLIADEPTSALDVTVQRQILDHLDRLKRELDTSLLLITHDLGVAADRADHIVVMSKGEVVEQGSPAQVLHSPQHPYTRRLIAAAPSLSAGEAAPAGRPGEGPRQSSALGGRPGDPFAAPDAAGVGDDRRPAVVLRVTQLVKEFPVPRAAGGGVRRAVDGVGFSIRRGTTLGLVGESGSGKSTTARIALRLTEPSSGTIEFDGQDITRSSGGALRQLRRRVQLVHQNPYASLNPRLSVEELVVDPLRAFRLGSARQRHRRAAELLEVVALPSSFLQRKAVELSGGQRQRVAIARALAIAPELLVLDEPVSALDVSVQDQILTLLAGLQADFGLSYLFISHDLAVVRRIAHEVIVMRAGRIVEQGATAEVFAAPEHPYTRELLAAIPGRSLPAAAG